MVSEDLSIVQISEGFFGLFFCLHAGAEHSTLKLDLCSASFLEGLQPSELGLHFHGKKTFPIPLAMKESVSEMGQDVEGAVLDIQHWVGMAQRQEM